METIISIERVENVDVKMKENRWSESCDGYEIKTDKQVIKLLISNGQSCCEAWGYFMSENELEPFEGAEIIDITVTDTALSTIVFEKWLGPEDMDMGGMMFVNINTNKGVLQFVAYNAHNGYYGHTGYVISEQLEHEENL